MKLSDNAKVLFCDNHLLIAEKPNGLLTQPTDSVEESLETFAKAWVKKEFQKKGSVFLHAIHRLDKPVSGLVLFAKTSKALSRLNAQAKNQEIQRIYLAEVEGVLSIAEGQLDHYLIHGSHEAKLSDPSHPKAKHARLTYRTLQAKAHSTLVEVALETGRYHQIRAQFAFSGHPILGDLRYGSQVDEGNAIRLHSAKLLFVHPVTKEKLSFESPAPFA